MCADANKIRHFIAGWSKNSYSKFLSSLMLLFRKKAGRERHFASMASHKVTMYSGGRKTEMTSLKLWKTTSKYLGSEAIWGNLWRFTTNPESHPWGSWELARESRVLLPAKDVLPTTTNESSTVTLRDSPKRQGQVEECPSLLYSEGGKMI